MENHGITGTLIAKAGLIGDDGDAFITRINLINNADIAVVLVVQTIISGAIGI